MIEKDSLLIEKKYLAEILHLTSDSIIFIDTKGEVVAVNVAAEKLIRWTEKEAVGKPVDAIFKLQEGADNPIYKSLKTGSAFKIDNQIIITKDKKKHVITGYAAPIYDEIIGNSGTILIFRESVDQQKLESEEVRTQKIDPVELLAKGIVHDFNNILASMLGNIHLAMVDLHQSDVLEKLLETEKALIRAKNLTQQLLIFSKIEKPAKEIINIFEPLKESIRFTLIGSNTRCEFSLPDSLWLVEADEIQINQVISNIVINASEAMPENGIIEVSAENIVLEPDNDLLMKPGRYVKTSILDHGPGIPEDDLQEIFEPYFTTKEGGHGLGLAISKLIIEKHKGRITVESQVGVGTVFHIYLPVYAEQESVWKKNISTVQIKGKVLLMDDDAEVREITCKLLNHFGYEVTAVADGDKAIDSYKKAMESDHPFDAVILDLNVPEGLGGVEVVQTLIQIDPKVKAIVLSGFSDDPVMGDFKKYGFRGVISKPYEIEEFKEILNSVITGTPA